ncbi:protein MIX23-like [Bolinopsis microptera]|uniref:protein MIX23-like n=1 Tax=Bolinopsis microptera TaxID=2820187 RepID=UPI00307AA026
MALPCDNFYEFKRLLTTFRDKDDKVIYNLNALLPTASFSDKVDAATNCQKFKTELLDLHQQREQMINSCLEFQQNKLASASNETKRPIQRVIRSLKQEASVEKIVKERSNAFFQTKCNPYMNFNASL